MAEPTDPGATGAHQPDESDLVTAVGAAGSVLHSFADRLPDPPRVRLREPADEPLTPVNRPASPEMPSAAAGSPVPARYQLVGEIARGGMGAVLKGRDTDLGRDIALKVLLERHRDRPELLRRFLEEAQISGQLQHPGIVPLYDIGQFADRRPYFTMKLIKGRTLAALLKERSPEDLSRFVGIFEQVCQTLAYAHDKGVLHRDLKPSNIMVGSFREVQVMDWGLAKVLAEGGIADEEASRGRQPPEDLSVIRTQRSEGSGTPAGSDTAAGTVLGTPAYMAPEQARGEGDLVDERADVFGLGAILCEVLTGRPPFTGMTAEAQRKAQTASLEDAYSLLAGCGADAELIELAKRCLAAEPGDRPRHAGEVAAAVTAYLESVRRKLRQTELARVEAQAKAAEERKRRRVQLALAASLLLTVVLGGGGLAWWWQQRTARSTDVEAALAEAAAHRDAGRWPEARAALERAAGRLGDAGPESLRQQVQQAHKDADLVAMLDEIRLRQMNVKEGKFDWRGADAPYATAFRGYGIDVEALTVVEAAAQVRASAIREELLAALDNWRWAKADADPDRTRLRAVADGADDSDWRQVFRAAEVRQDGKELRELAGRPEALEQPPAVLAQFGKCLQQVGLLAEAAAFLRQAQQRHPGDFWINLRLAATLQHVRPRRTEEAVGYYRAAVAIRPRSLGAQLNLGYALKATGDLAGAIACYRKAVQLEPKDALGHYNLGVALHKAGDAAGAIACYREAIELKPDLIEAHFNLRLVLEREGDFVAALAAVRRGHELGAKDPHWHYPSAQWVQEAERRVEMDRKLPAILAGNAEPAGAAERIELAGVCYFRKLYATAVQFSADAFAAEPKLASQSGHRYNAACSAALAAAGKGENADTLDDKERTRLRQQALDWLKADLARWSTQLDGGKPEDRAAVEQTLRHWQRDPDLAGLRDDQQLAKLSPDERQACRKLWKEVAALLAKCQQR